MFRHVKALLALLCAFSFLAEANAAMYTGFLKYEEPLDAGDGLHVEGGAGSSGGSRGWLTDDAVMRWTVTNEDAFPAGFPWKYTYTFSAFLKDISHVILETSPSFTDADITGVTGAVLEDDNPKLQKVTSGNPNMPEDVFGLRFLEDTAGPSWTISFFSTRAPVWGDFYAKDGKSGGIENLAYNRGFTVSDVDPSDAAANGSVAFHILVPDTTGGEIPTVPAPGTLVGLVSIGLLGLARGGWKALSRSFRS